MKDLQLKQNSTFTNQNKVVYLAPTLKRSAANYVNYTKNRCEKVSSS